MSTSPRVVALGGGTGLSSLLMAIKHLAIEHLTAVVTVTDDGGSTGRLRREFDIPAVGDLRHCLVALAEDHELLARLFDHRFAGNGELGGHSLGNLFLTGLLQMTGDVSRAVRLSAEVLNVRGTILPATTANVHLVGWDRHGGRLEGESRVSAAGPPARVELEPESPPAVPEAVAAIQAADLILLGPGSLFTSLIPNLLVPGIARAVAARRGRLVWVANLMTQPGETSGMSLADHLEAITRHAPGVVPDVVLANDRPASPEVAARYREQGADPLLASPEASWPGPGRLLGRPLLRETPEGLVRHDRAALASAVLALLETAP
jgi:uncharacterized cofD-like protein